MLKDRQIKWLSWNFLQYSSFTLQALVMMFLAIQYFITQVQELRI